MATTFCTNHVRQIGLTIVKKLQKEIRRRCKHKDVDAYTDASLLRHRRAASAVLCGIFRGKSHMVHLIPLTIVFTGLLYADRVTEHDKIEETPRDIRRIHLTITAY